jgi:hypothetical protein
VRSIQIIVTYGVLALIGGGLGGLMVESAECTPRAPDWMSVVTETRQRLGPVRPLQSCLDYSRETANVCRERGLDCFEVSFSCSTGGHSVVVGRQSTNGVNWCRILDATNRDKPDARVFQCDTLKQGTIRPSPIYCDGDSDCRCEILEKERVYTSSDPSSAAAMYQPTPIRSFFGARSRCIASCEEQRVAHEQGAAVIQAACSGELKVNPKSELWGIQSWLAPMPRREMCRYSARYSEESVRFHQTCVESCDSFGKYT